MGNQTIFTFQSDGDIHQHQVAAVDTKKARELIANGKAVEVSLGAYDDLRQQAKSAHSAYRKAEARINASDNPLHTADYKQYEIDKLYADYEEKTKAIQAEYEQARAAMVSEAKATSARATVKISESDKQTAEQVANRISLSIATATNAADLSEIIRQAGEDIGYLGDAEKTAIQSTLSGIIGQIEAKADKYGATISARPLISSAQDIRNMELLGAKVAAQLPNRVDTEYRQLKTIRKGRRTTARGINQA